MLKYQKYWNNLIILPEGAQRPAAVKNYAKPAKADNKVFLTVFNPHLPLNTPPRTTTQTNPRPQLARIIPNPDSLIPYNLEAFLKSLCKNKSEQIVEKFKFNSFTLTLYRMLALGQSVTLKSLQPWLIVPPNIILPEMKIA